MAPPRAHQELRTSKRVLHETECTSTTTTGLSLRGGRSTARSGTMARMPEGDTIFRAAAQLRAGARRQGARRARAPPRSARSTCTRGRHRDHGRRRGGQAPPRALRRRPGAAHPHADDRRVACLRAGRALAATRAHRGVIVRVADGTTAVCFAAPIVELRRERKRPLLRPAPLGCSTVSARTSVHPMSISRSSWSGSRASNPTPSSPPRCSTNGLRPASATSSSRRSAGRNACHPFTPLRDLDTPARRRIYETAKLQLGSNLASSRRTTFGTGLAVYRRAGRRCPRCGDTIVSRRDLATRRRTGAPGANRVQPVRPGR